MSGSFRYERGSVLRTTRFKIKNKSTVSPLWYAFLQLYGGYWFRGIYMDLFFMPLHNYTANKSKKIFLLCLFISFGIGYVVRRKRCMTIKSSITDVMVGLGMYTVLAYHLYYRKWIVTLAIVFCIFVIGYVAYVFTRRVNGKKLFQIRDMDQKLFVIKNRTVRTLNIVGVFLGIWMIVLMAPIGYNRAMYGGIVVADSEYSTTGFDINYRENELSLKNNLDTIEKIRENARWMPLTTKEKLQVLQTIADCEANSFGMDSPITVVIDDLSRGTLGAYDDSQRKVIIDRHHLENSNADLVLRTCLHECYHAWQHCLVRLYLDSTESQRKMRVFNHCEEYMNEIMDYKNAGEDLESYIQYYGQYLEKDSREYAENNVFEYYEEIDILQENYEKYRGQIID